MLNAHDHGQPPIGKWDDVHLEDGQLVGTTNFDESDPVAANISRKMENGYLNMVSIGALPLELSDEPSLKLAGQKGPTITKWKLKEVSPVAFGSNKNAFVQLYDQAGEKIEMNDANIIALFEGQPTFKTKNQMKELAKLLNLAESAIESEYVNVVKALQEKTTSIEVELSETKTKLTIAETKLTEIANAKVIALKAEAKSLVDAAVKDARIDAAAIESYLKLFDLDFDSAKKTLESIPKRSGVAYQINNKSVTELADLSAKSWDELDKANKLTILKEKYPEVYQQKHDEKFPQN